MRNGGLCACVLDISQLNESSCNNSRYIDPLTMVIVKEIIVKVALGGIDDGTGFTPPPRKREFSNKETNLREG